MKTIYGDYVADAICQWGGGPWHIEGPVEGVSLCGKQIPKSWNRMRLHVAFLECSMCQSLGEAYVESLKVTALSVESVEEIVRARMEKAWDEGVAHVRKHPTDYAYPKNPYRKEG